MGQKTNQNLLRLGTKNAWKSKYIEKKSNERLKYDFNYLELRKFIYKFFEQNGLLINNCKISYSESFFHIFISYYNLPKTKLLTSTTNNKHKVKLSLRKIKSKKYIKKNTIIKDSTSNYNCYNQKHSIKKINRVLTSKQPIKKIKEHFFFEKKLRRLDSVTAYKKYSRVKNLKNNAQIQTQLFLKKLLESIRLFLDTQTNVSFSLCQLNSDNAVIKTFSKKKKNLISTNLLKLRKFQKNDFFKMGIPLLYNCVINDECHSLLSNYIAFHLKTFKRHNFFLSFLKNTLKIFLTDNFSKIKRIKILVTGRFNGAPRAKKNILTIGVPPSLTINSNIKYSETVSFTANGTFGIKVWTYSFKTNEQI